MSEVIDSVGPSAVVHDRSDLITVKIKNGIELEMSKSWLSMHSSVFASMLQGEPDSLSLPKMHYSAMRHVIDFSRSGKLDALEPRSLEALFLTTQRFGLTKLAALCETQLAEITWTNCYSRLVFANKHKLPVVKHRFFEFLEQRTKVQADERQWTMLVKKLLAEQPNSLVEFVHWTSSVVLD